MPDISKPILHQHCIAVLHAKTDRLEKAIADAQKAASEDTKSSAGDKFETSREMMKAEIDKHNHQLSQAIEMLSYLKKAAPETAMDQVGFGSLVTTNEGRYYFSVALGKVIPKEQSFFALSMASPIGQVLNAKKEGDSVLFMGRTITIQAIE